MSVISPTDVPEKITASGDTVKRERPQITEMEDRPFEELHDDTVAGDSLIPKRIEEKEQEHKHRVEDYKNNVGGALLAACFLIIVGFSIADAYFKIESGLFSGAFEFAKTIATAVIGYLFATNTKDK